MKTIEVFVSLPMNGISEDEIWNRMNDIFDSYAYFYTHSKDRPNSPFSLHLMDTLHHEGIDADAGRLVYLGESIKLLQNADIVIFAKDWKEAKGCKVENAVCKLYNIPIIYEENI